MSETITIDDFAKVGLHAGRVIEASAPEWSNKLIKQRVDFGPELGERVIFSGLRKWYAPEDFVDKTLVYVTNLAPRKMGEEVSEGMIMVVEDGDGKPLRWELPTTVKPGTRVG